MTTGRLIAVVGPSGVGKDSIMRGLCDVVPDMHLVRRVITRAPDLGGEDYDAVTEAEFEEMVANGAFALFWNAHGLRYGIPRTVMFHLNRGTDCLANVSRKSLQTAAVAFPNLVVLKVTAQPDTLANRLQARGRESGIEVTRRLAEADKPLPQGLRILNLSNDGPLDQAVACAAALLKPVAQE